MPASGLVGIQFGEDVRVLEIEHADTHGAAEFVSREGGGLGLGEAEWEFADDLGGVAKPGLCGGVEGSGFVAAGGENQRFAWVGVDRMSLVWNDGDAFEFCGNPEGGMLERGQLQVLAEIEEGVARFGRAGCENDLGRVFDVEKFGDFGTGLFDGVMSSGSPGVEGVWVAVLGGEPEEHCFQSGGVERSCGSVIEVVFGEH